jgi:putative lipoic acid-binding regulatory protein
MSHDGRDDTGFEYPCEYAVKAMGLAEPGFEATVIEIIRPHAPGLAVESVSTRLSRNGKYLSVTVLIEAVSRSQLDAIYADLTAHEKVLMRL